MNLFASAGGLPVWANLLLALTEEVESAMQSELTAREARIAKYTAKYKKKRREVLLCKLEFVSLIKRFSHICK